MTHFSRRVLEQEFAEVRDNVLRLGSLVDIAVERAMLAVRQRDLDLARQVIDDDVIINDLRFKVEEECMVMIATQQPAASDLRAIVAAMHVVTDLERMADHATGIAKTVQRMEGEPPLEAPPIIPQMAQRVRDMLRQSLDTFLARDIEGAKAVAARDDEIDVLYQALFDALLQQMIADPAVSTRATYLLWIGHNLERMGDRVTNIAERVVYMRTGDITDLNA